MILDHNHNLTKNQSALVNKIVGDSLEKVRLGYLKLVVGLNWGDGGSAETHLIPDHNARVSEGELVSGS